LIVEKKTKGLQEIPSINVDAFRRLHNKSNPWDVFYLTNLFIYSMAVMIHITMNNIHAKVEDNYGSTLYSEVYFWDEYMPAHQAPQGEFAAAWHRQRALPILSHLRPFQNGKKLLEVGCAAGFFLKIAQEEGWQVCGVEVMTPAVEYARSVWIIKAKRTDRLLVLAVK